MLSSRALRNLRSESGFTLLELLAVAVILVIMALMALPVYAKVTDDARQSKSTEQLRVVEQALEAYRADPDHNHYPDTLNALIQEGFLKPSSDPNHSLFESSWSNRSDRVYFYYAVDNLNAPNGFILIGADANTSCRPNTTTPSFCRSPETQAWENPSLSVPADLYPPGLTGMDLANWIRQFERDMTRTRKSR